MTSQVTTQKFLHVIYAKSLYVVIVQDISVCTSQKEEFVGYGLYVCVQVVHQSQDGPRVLKKKNNLKLFFCLLLLILLIFTRIGK